MTNKCKICGEDMPAGEEMFKIHGYSGPCPKPIKTREDFEDDLIRDVTIAVRESDALLEKIGGGARHWVRDCLLPVLEARGYKIVKVKK